MKNKIIFELKLNSKDRIIAYEKKNYDICYEDSLLYINIDNKKTKIVESSFCYGFGAEMYYRIYNLKDFTGSSNFIELLVNDFNAQTYDEDDFTRKTNNIHKNSYFASCNSSTEFDLYLFKNNGSYILLIVKLWEIESTGKYEAKILKEFEINENVITDWKTVICAEWERRAVIEGEKISGTKQSMEEWQKYFNIMRNDKNNN